MSTPAAQAGAFARSLTRTAPALSAEEGYVLSCCPIASAVGLRVLHEGGNAIDAAVATAVALAVTVPEAGNLGGGGFMLIQAADGSVHGLDYRERAPRRVAALDLSDHRCLMGASAVAVPGTVAGLAEALARFGSWSWQRVVALSIDLAETGFFLSARQALYLELYAPELSAFESTRRCFFPDGRPPLPGTRFRQPALAATLATLAADGPLAFYRGAIAERLAAGVARHGGVIDLEDLASYEPRWRTPFSVAFCGRRVHTAALPSGGGLIVALALALCETAGIHDLPAGSAAQLDLLARILRAAALERIEWAGDPDELDDAARATLRDLPATWATPERAAALQTPTATGDAPPTGGDNTTHFCTIDRWGNAVSNTYSLNTRFGSKLVCEGTGFLLNNTMDDFVLVLDGANYYGLRESARNVPAPGRRPAGSMAPTIVSGEDGPELLLGSAGGPRIPSTIVQLILDVVGSGLPLDEAMRQPRIHHQGAPDILYVEQGIAPATCSQLAERGHQLAAQPEIGMAAALQRNTQTGGRLFAAMDPRYQCRP